MLAVKWWAKKNEINEARFQTLSSYTLSLMVIHFLQCEVTPPVLPCLQKSHPHIFNSKSDIFNLPYEVPEYRSENKDSTRSTAAKLSSSAWRRRRVSLTRSGCSASVRCAKK